MHFLNKLSKYADWAPLFIRVALGALLIAHGYAKFFSLGISGVTGFFGGVGIPAAAFFAVVVSLVELVGGILLLLGLFTRIAALFVVIEFIVIVLMKLSPTKLKAAFIGGWEFDLLILAAALALLLRGSGTKLAADTMMKKKE